MRTLNQGTYWRKALGKLQRPSLLVLMFLSSPMVFAGTENRSWVELGKGVEYSETTLNTKTGIKLNIVRVDPTKARLVLELASQNKGERTAKEWCVEKRLIAAINAGMFQTDHVSNVGYLKNGKHIQNGRWNNKYKSALAFGARKKGVPEAVMVDLDSGGAYKVLEDYDSVVQNLRLLKGKAVNVWSVKDKNMWSEVAVAIDDKGRILFLFCRTPMNMYSFNNLVKTLNLGVEKMMHAEGGPEASLSIHGDGKDVDLSGSYETGFNEDESNEQQWPLPNVLGVKAR